MCQKDFHPSAMLSSVSGSGRDRESGKGAYDCAMAGVSSERRAAD